MSLDTWQLYRFDQIAQNINERVLPADAEGLPYVGLEHLDSESLKIRRWGTPDEVEAQKLRFYPGDIIFGKRRFYQRKLAVAEVEGICSAHAMVLRPREDVVDPAFLPFFMQSEMFFERAMAISVGSLSPTINWTALARQEFPLPPLDEQRRIAEILWAVEEAIEGYIDGLREAKVLEESFSRTVFSHTTESVRLPLGKVASLQVGYPFKSKEFSNTGDRLLRCSNVSIGKLIWDEGITRYFPSDKRHEVSDFVLCSGDIVIAMDRPFITEGFKIARVTEFDLPALLLQRVGRFRLSENIDLDYLWFFVQSSAFKNHLQRSQQGTDLPHISKFDVESIEVELPQLQEQRRIAAKFSHIEQNRRDIQSHLTRLIDLKRRLLARILVGKTG